MDDEVILVLLNVLRLARPMMEPALERAVEDQGRQVSDLRMLEAACAALKEDANAVTALLIARPGGEDMITEAEELFRYFSQAEAEIGAVLDRRS